MANSSTLAWKIPWMEKPGRLQSMGSQSQTQLSDFIFTFMSTESGMPSTHFVLCRPLLSPSVFPSIWILMLMDTVLCLWIPSHHIFEVLSYVPCLGCGILSGAVSPLFPRSIVDAFQPGGGSSSGVIAFCLCVLFMGFSQQECWSGLLSSPPMDHVLSELSCVTCPFWVVLHSMAHSFTVTQVPLP